MDISLNFDGEMSRDEEKFIEDNAEDLCELILQTSNKSEKDAIEFGNTFASIKIIEFMDAMRDICLDLIEEQFGLEVCNRVANNEIVDDNSPEDLLAGTSLYEHTMDLCTGLLEEYFIPAIALEQLHKQWQKRHGMRVI